MCYYYYYYYYCCHYCCRCPFSRRIAMCLTFLFCPPSHAFRFKKNIWGFFDYVPLCFLPACSSIYFLSYEYRNSVVLELEPPAVSLVFTSSVVFTSK